MSKKKKTAKAAKKKRKNEAEGTFLEVGADYNRSVIEMQGIGESFRLDSKFRTFMRDYIYDITRLCKDIAWKVVTSDAAGDISGSGLGSKQDVLFILTALLQQVLPDTPALYRIWRRMEEGYYEKMGGADGT